ncbi:MAG: hypothetical protein GY702_23710 [Desulfobulbaceae bacterium]|nr:hypothetical protein [Desulfobulbaceae bacterium]
MKIVKILSPVILFLMLAAAPCFSSNKENCQMFCNDDRGCEKCSKMPGCGPGYSPMATFKNFHRDFWYACKQNSYGRHSERNKSACLEWCEENNQCKKCSENIGCGANFKKIMSFTGTGKNWHACKKTMHSQASDRNEAQCKDWCDNNELCEKCSTLRGCGGDYTSMKHWTGTGKNWHACRKSGAASNKAACLQWCQEKDNCRKCSEKPGCGMGYKKMKSFKGPGKNWYSCKKR